MRSSILFCMLPLLLPCIVMGQDLPAEEDGGQAGIFTYKHTEHGDLKLTVDYPPAWEAFDNRPAIVFFFGGGWTWGTIEHFERQAKYFASRGMVVIRPDFRVKDRQGTTPAESVEDAKSAIRWVRTHADTLGIDPQRIVASGGSSGGHLAACTAYCPGPGNTEEDFSISAEPDALILFNPLLEYHGRSKVEQAYPVSSEEIARQISPVLHVEKGGPPTLLLFGAEDPLFGWASSYIEKSRELGNHVELFLAEGEGHAFFNKSPWYEYTLIEADKFLESLNYLASLPVNKER